MSIAATRPSLPGAPTSNAVLASLTNIMGDYGNFNAPRTLGVEASPTF